jgi:cell division protein FtsL
MNLTLTQRLQYAYLPKRVISMKKKFNSTIEKIFLLLAILIPLELLVEVRVLFEATAYKTNKKFACGCIGVRNDYIKKTTNL